MFLSQDKHTGIFYLYYHKRKGKRNKITTKTRDKAEAEKFMADFGIPKKKVTVKKDTAKEVTVWDYGFTYMTFCERHHRESTIRGYMFVMKSFRKWYGKYKLSEITTKMVRDYLESRFVETSVYAARKDQIVLSGFFRRAIEDGHIKENPVKPIKQYKLPETLPLFFSELEYKKLMETITDPDMKDLVEFATHTGMRLGEITNLAWRQINFNSALVILDNRSHTTKSGKIRSIPLNSNAVSVLTRRANQMDGEYVFTFQGKKVNAPNFGWHFKQWIIKAKLNRKLHFHSLRHTFA